MPRWRAFDYVLDYLTGDLPVPEQTWRTATAAASSPEDLDAVGYRAYAEGHRDTALTLYEQLAASGHPDLAPQAMSNLGALLQKRGEVEEAERWWRRGADAGDGAAMSNLGALLEHRGEVEGAEQWYRNAAETGHPAAFPMAAARLEQLTGGKGLDADTGEEDPRAT